jgi:hypothetical protein
MTQLPTRRWRRTTAAALVLSGLVAPVLTGSAGVVTAAPAAPPVVAAEYVLPFEWRDFTGDGVSDLVGRQAGTGDIYVFRHTGTFDATRTYDQKFLVAGQAQNYNWMGVSDITGDFTADLVARDNNGDLIVRPGSGRPVGVETFLAPVVLGNGWNGLSQLALSDVTGDGYTDITGMRGNGELVVYPHTGMFDGINTFAPPELLGTGWDIMSWIGAGEVTSADEKPDLLGVRRDNGTLQVYPHKPFYDNTNSYSGPVQAGTGWDTVQIAGIADVSRDGFGDLVVKRSNGDLVVYPNSGRLSGDTTFKGPVLVGTGWNGIDLVAS